MKRIIFIEINEFNENVQAICIVLLNLFLENNVTLDDLYVSINIYENPFLDYAYEMFSNNPTFISNIENFTCYLVSNNSSLRNEEFKKNIKSFETFIPSLPSSFKHLYIFFDTIFFYIFINIFR